MVEPKLTPGGRRSGAERFLPQVALAGAANVVGAVGSAAAGLLIARALGPAERGVVAGATAWAGLLGLLASLGLVQAVTYYVAREPAATQWVLRRATAWVLPPTTVVAAAGVLFAVVKFDHGPAYVYGAAFLSLPFTVVGGLHVAALQAVRTTWWNAARLVQQSVYLVGIGVAFYFGQLQLDVIALVILISIVLQLLVARVLIHASSRGHDRQSSLSGSGLLRYGAQNLLAAVPNTVNARLDQALLAVVASRSELGSYAVAVSLSLVAGPLAGAFGSVAFPRLAALFDDEGGRRTMERSALLGTLIVAGLVGVLLAGFAPTIVRTLFGPDFADAIPLVRILVPAGVALACNLVLADLLRGRGRPRAPAAAEGSSAVLTVVLLALLAPRFGATAAAWVSLLAYSLSTVLLLRFLRHARS